MNEHWTEDEMYPVADWVMDAANGDTRLSYKAWTHQQREQPEVRTGAFTPGPWVAESEVASCGRGIAICAPNDDLIVATILPSEERFGTPWPRKADKIDWANARLLAAAPELRERLIEMVAWAVNVGECHRGAEMEDFVVNSMEDLVADCEVVLEKLQ